MHSIDSLFHYKFQPYVSLNLLFNIMVLYYNSIVFLSSKYHHDGNLHNGTNKQNGKA